MIGYVTADTEPTIMSHTIQLLMCMQPARLMFWVVVMLAVSCLPTSVLVLRRPDLAKTLALVLGWCWEPEQCSVSTLGARAP
jgi:hypothetical protein